jgi:hypothetical protein
MSTSLLNPFQFFAHQSSLYYTFFCLSYWQHRETNHKKTRNNVSTIGLHNYFLHSFAVLCPPIFIFLSTSFSLAGIVASYFYSLFFSLRSLSFSTYTFNILLYIFFCIWSTLFWNLYWKLLHHNRFISVFVQILRCFADNNKTYL